MISSPLRLVHSVAWKTVPGYVHLAARSTGVFASEGITVRFAEKAKTSLSESLSASSMVMGRPLNFCENGVSSELILYDLESAVVMVQWNVARPPCVSG